MFGTSQYSTSEAMRDLILLSTIFELYLITFYNNLSTIVNHVLIPFYFFYSTFIAEFQKENRHLDINLKVFAILNILLHIIL